MNDASNLHSHPFNHSIFDNSICLNCYYSVEDNEHFFLDCPDYNVERSFLSPSHILLDDNVVAILVDNTWYYRILV